MRDVRLLTSSRTPLFRRGRPSTSAASTARRAPSSETSGRGTRSVRSTGIGTISPRSCTRRGTPGSRRPSGQALCSAGAGTVLQLNYIEGAPGPHPLKGDVLNLGVTFAELLGAAYGAATLRVTKPAPHVVQALDLLGYRHVARSQNPPYYHFSDRSLP